MSWSALPPSLRSAPSLLVLTPATPAQPSRAMQPMRPMPLVAPIRPTGAAQPAPVRRPTRPAGGEEDARRDQQHAAGLVSVTERPAEEVAHLYSPYSLGSAHAAASWRWSPISPSLPARTKPVMRLSPSPVSTSAPTDERASVTDASVTSPHAISHAMEAAVRVPDAIRRSMAAVAAASRRSESDLWAEAARAWLDSRAYDDDPLPPAPASALAVPRPARSWEAIDNLLADLRQPNPDEIAA